MKKKAIEKIPYLGLKQVSRGKDVKYIGVTAGKIVGHEKHLFLEVYRNEKESMNIPVVRIAVAKKDFGTYYPGKDTWTREKIAQDYYYSLALVWDKEGGRAERNTKAKANILASEEDMQRIEKFCGENGWYKSEWWEHIYRFQSSIVHEERRRRENRKYERRQQALKDRQEHTPELPEAEILEMADRFYFHQKHFLYYKKRGCRVRIACTKCGGVTEARWKGGISYESQYQKWVDPPKEGDIAPCPMCGETGEYKCQGKVKGMHSQKIYAFLGQKYKETGMVFRYIELMKEWKLGLVEDGEETVMYNASEEISGIEVARAYLMPGEKTQIDYHKHSWVDGKDYWDDCNLYGNANITIHAGRILPHTYREMQGTIFQYSALQEYEKMVPEVNPVSYLERCLDIPQLEMIVKMGLSEIAASMVRCECGIIADTNAKRLDKFLGIRKERTQQLIKSKGNCALLEVMKMEKNLKQNWTDEQIEHLAVTRLRQGQVEQALQYMGIQKLLNRIERYAGCRYESACLRAQERIRHMAVTYMDYLGMRLSLGYDLTNTVYQQPRDLEAAHNKMAAEQNKKEADKRLQEVKKKFAGIRNSYRKLRNRYFYEDDEYIIRPARSAEEIVMEGRILHHCVGGDRYLGKHNDGQTYILMLRFAKEPEIPYITVEIERDTHQLIQWYGAHDHKPDEEHMQKWLDDYVGHLKQKDAEAKQRAQSVA